MIFNAHSDILSDINLKRLNGEKNVFRNYHYNNFLKSGVNGGIFVIWTDPDHSHNPQERTKQIINSMLNEFEENTDIINVVKSYSDIINNPKSKKINIIIGMEGLEHIGENIDLIEYYYNNIGLRHISLTWNEKNLLASGIYNKHAGITKAGIKAIEKIEELGIILDVSHLNVKSFWDVVNVASGPIIASHSNAKYLANVDRNLDDEQLVAIAESGGIVGINACSNFVSCDPFKHTINDFIAHIDYLKNLIGINHIAFGFDFCDYLPASYIGQTNLKTKSVTVSGLSSEADIVNLIDSMKKCGYSQTEIELISYGNFMNYLKKVFKN